MRGVLDIGVVVVVVTERPGGYKQTGEETDD
jgi:hypothetical protein